MTIPKLTSTSIKDIVNNSTDEELLQLYNAYKEEGSVGSANILRTEVIRNKVLSNTEWVWTEALEELIAEESRYLSDFNTSIFCLKGEEPFTIARRHALLSFSRINTFITAISEQRKESPNNWKYVYIFNKEWDLVCDDPYRKQFVMYLISTLSKEETYGYKKSLPYYADKYEPELGAILRTKEVGRDATGIIDLVEGKYAALTLPLEGELPSDAEKLMGVYLYLTADSIEQEDYVKAQNYMKKAIELLPRGDFLKEALLFLQKVLPKE